MGNEKKAFLGPLASILFPIAGSMVGGSIATRTLAPKIWNYARKKFRTLDAIPDPGFITRQKKKILKSLGRRKNATDIAGGLGFTVGAPIGSIGSIPFMLPENNQEQDMEKYSEHRLFGFLKAAMQADMSLESTVKLTKVAFGDYDLKPEDIARIRMALQEEGVPAPYSDPQGPANANYNENILKARDTSLDQIPEVEGSLSAVRKGAVGAGVGGAAGYGVGSILNAPNVLGSGVPYGMKKRLPGALGTSGVILGALLSALPAYKQKVDQVKGLQKLNYPENMQTLINSIEKDKALLSS